MHPRTMAVPRSGCITMSSPAEAVTKRSGPMMRRSVAPSSSRRVIRSAVKIVSASFISSEGCRRNWPKPIHRLDPWACTPRPGTRTTRRRRKVTPKRSGASRRSLRWSKRTATPNAMTPTRHPHGLSDEDGPGAAVEGDGDHRRGGADHHQADDAEEAHDDGEHRPGRQFGDRRCEPRRRSFLGPGSPRPLPWHQPRARPLTRGGRPGCRARCRARLPRVARTRRHRSPPSTAREKRARHPTHVPSFPHGAARVVECRHVIFATERKSA